MAGAAVGGMAGETFGGGSTQNLYDYWSDLGWPEYPAAIGSGSPATYPTAAPVSGLPVSAFYQNPQPYPTAQIDLTSMGWEPAAGGFESLVTPRTVGTVIGAALSMAGLNPMLGLVGYAAGYLGTAAYQSGLFAPDTGIASAVGGGTDTFTGGATGGTVATGYSEGGAEANAPMFPGDPQQYEPAAEVLPPVAPVPAEATPVQPARAATVPLVPYRPTLLTGGRGVLEPMEDFVIGKPTLG
uniref:Uncharacterized protein n=1 Tax=viral metagenome TaxID=1070528 RepID=A0A6M3K186_9ZZZZ